MSKIGQKFFSTKKIKKNSSVREKLLTKTKTLPLPSKNTHFRKCKKKKKKSLRKKKNGQKNNVQNFFLTKNFFFKNFNFFEGFLCGSISIFRI